MKAKTYSTKDNTLSQRFTLDLSFTEMHVIMQAMSTYGSKHGYGQWNTYKPNEKHVEAAETLYGELTDLYAVEEHDVPIYEMSPLEKGIYLLEKDKTLT